MRRRPHAALLAEAIRIKHHQTDYQDNGDALEQHVTDLSPPFPTAAEVHDILQIPPAPTCINDGRPLSPVRLIDGRWVSDDSTTPERRYTAEGEHPGECWGKVRDFHCLPLPEEPTPEEEVAPWDDPMIMSTEDLAELIGL